MTVASGAASAISARTDFSARDSCTKPRIAFRITIAEDDDRLVGQGAFARILQQPFDHRDDDGDEQDDHQEVLELLEQPLPPRRFRRALQLVRSVLIEALLRLSALQAACGVGAEFLDDRIGWLAVRRLVAMDARTQRRLRAVRWRHVSESVLQFSGRAFGAGHMMQSASTAAARRERVWLNSKRVIS